MLGFAAYIFCDMLIKLDWSCAKNKTFVRFLLVDILYCKQQHQLPVHGKHRCDTHL